MPTQNKPEGLTVIQGGRLESIKGILGELPVGQRNKVLAETESFLQAQREAALHYLAMGQHLKYVRDVLEPIEKWVVYTNLLPNVSQATAYRMIWAFENSSVLPEATRNVAVSEGYKLISNQKGQTFAPGYEKAVKQVTKEVGPPPKTDEVEAREWLRAVVQAKKQLSKKVTRETRSSSSMVNIEATEKRIMLAVERIATKLDPTHKKEFGLRLAGMIATACECPGYRLKPVPIPEELKLSA